MEKVIFRKENYTDNGYENYLAVFCDGSARPGYHLCLPFHFVENGTVFEAHDEVSCGYYYSKTKLVRRNDPIIPKCVAAIERFTAGGAIQVMERMSVRIKY